MNSSNTLGIGNALKASGLEYFPEAHCYLRYSEKIMDLTNLQSDIVKLIPYILEDQTIQHIGGPNHTARAGHQLQSKVSSRV